MSIKHLRPTLLLLAMLCTVSAAAQVTIVHNGKAKSRIVLTGEDRNDATAAKLLQDFVYRISGAELQIVNGQDLKKLPSKNDIVIGNNLTNKDFVSDSITEDGFRLCTKDGRLRIISGGDKGSIYGVVTLLLSSVHSRDLSSFAFSSWKV